MVEKMKLKVILTFIALVAAVSARAQETSGADSWPVAVDEIIVAQPFVLEKSYRFDWSAERQDVREGTLVVLKADPELVMPRNALEPVLYAGNKTVQRLNHGAGTGILIGIIPGNVDLATTPIWFGAPGLPESVTDETIRKERALAERSEIRPFAEIAVERASRERVAASDLADLLRTRVADLVIEYVPEERSLAATWRLPVVSAPQKERR